MIGNDRSLVLIRDGPDMFVCVPRLCPFHSLIGAANSGANNHETRTRPRLGRRSKPVIS
jgi:hypothetical protein